MNACNVYDKLNHRGVRICNLNIVTLLGKFDHVKQFLVTTGVEVLALNETRLDNVIDNNELYIPGYNLYRKDRNRHGGGVAIYVSEKYSSHLINTEKNDIESLWVKIMLPHGNHFVVGTAYRSEEMVNKTYFFECLEQQLNGISISSKDIFLVGDLNLDSLVNGLAAPLKHLCQLFQLKQLIKEPTRVTRTSESCIDHIFTNASESRIHSSGVIPLGLSDHSLVYVIKKCVKPNYKPRVIKTRSFRNFNGDNFCNDLNNVPWHVIEFSNCVDDAWDMWKKLFLEVCDIHAPYVNIRCKGYTAPWVTDEFLNLSKERDFRRLKAQKEKSESAWLLYKESRNKVNNLGKTLKRKYYCSKIDDCKNDSAKLWKTLKEMLPNTKSGSTINSVVDKNGVQCTEPKEIANNFNEFFVSIGKKLAEKFTDDMSESCCSVSDVDYHFTFHEIDNEFVLKQLLSLDMKKATGLDGISAKLLKIGAHCISQSLTYILNMSLKSGIVPTEWKHAKVTPLHKEGNKDDTNNYRPISVLPVVMKIFESAVNIQLRDFLVANNILAKEQSGFRAKHSTCSTLLDVTDFLLNNMSNGLVTGAIFLDLKKAFDTVDHKILLSKLYRLGIKGIEHKWFRNYLTSRCQSVSINGTLSDSLNIDIGVPQGSILGPLLFILYINDLTNVIDEKCKVVLYADDTALFYACNDPCNMQHILNDQLSKVGLWLQRNKLTLNVKKTNLMLIGTSQRLTKYNDVHAYVNGEKLCRVKNCKYLGVWIDDNMNWTVNIEKTCNKISKRIGVIRRLRSCLDINTLNILYKSMILPVFDYCDIVYSNCSSINLNILEKLQNRAARAITGSPPWHSATDLRNKLGWMKIKSRWLLHKCVFMYKCVNYFVPLYISSKFKYAKDVHQVNTRSSANYQLAIHDKCNMRSFQYQGAIEWNKLPLQIRAINRLQSFKDNVLNHVRDYIVENGDVF